MLVEGSLRCRNNCLKCSYDQKAFLGFGVSIISKNVFKPKKVNSDTFCHKFKLYISRFGHTKWSWPRNVRLVTNDVTSGMPQNFMFLFCLPDHRIALPTSAFFCFCRGKLLNSNQTTVTWTRKISWFLTWRHDPFRNRTLFCTDERSTSLGGAEEGTLKLDLRALKSQNPILFFLRIPFYIL